MVSFNYNGRVCSDLETIKNFLEELIKKLNGIIHNKDILFDVKLILNELMINGALHGNECGNEKCVSLLLDVKDKKITIQVIDEGVGINFDISSYDPTNLLCGGRGLVLVNGLSDELYIDKNRVTAIKHMD